MENKSAQCDSVLLKNLLEQQRKSGDVDKDTRVLQYTAERNIVCLVHVGEKNKTLVLVRKLNGTLYKQNL